MKRAYDDIINSGMLEQYLLGELSEAETREVTSMLEKSEELQNELAKMELAFENLAKENAVSPPDSVKAAVLNSISKESKVIPINNSSNYKAYLAVVASIALLFLFGGLGMYQKLNQVEENLQIVSEENNTLKETIVALEKDYENTLQWYAAINAADSEKLVFKGNDLAPNAIAVGYVNHTKKSVIVNAEGLTKLPEDKDFQLWADVDGEMISMGVIPKDAAMITMKYVENASSLNITIEPAGGSEHATVENLVANAYLKATP